MSWATHGTLGLCVLGAACTVNGAHPTNPTPTTGSSSKGGAHSLSGSTPAWSAPPASSSSLGATSENAASASSAGASLAPFQILGITGQGDTTPDAQFTGAGLPSVTWSPSAGHSAYDVTLLDAETGVVRCPTARVAYGATAYTYTTCRGNLRELGAYWAQVVALDDAGHTLDAANSPWAFTNDPTPAADHCEIAARGAVVANGLAQDRVTITLRNSAAAPLEGLTPTFEATNTGGSNIYGRCSPTSAAGVSQCTLSSTHAETKTLTLLTPVRVTGGPVQFLSGPPAALVWDGPQPTAGALNGCSAPFTVMFQDAQGNPTLANANLTLTLGCVGGDMGTFYTGPGCALAPSSNVAAQPGDGRVTFSFKPNASGRMAVQVSMTGDAPLTQTLMVTATAPRTWTQMSVVRAPTARNGHVLVWSGTEMMVWGGAPPSTSTYAGTLQAPAYTNGARYNAVLDAWAPMSSQGAPTGTVAAAAVWSTTTQEMLVWGGVDSSGTTSTALGGGYNPVTDTWRPINPVGAPAARCGHVAVWSGTHMVVWGGVTAYGGWSLSNGAQYNPLTDTWAPMSNAGAPLARGGESRVWTGTELIIWGGWSQDFAPLNSGGRYNPALDTWTSLPRSGAPAPRTGHGAVWTGQEMVIFGGDISTLDTPAPFAGTGGRFNPATGTWRPTSGVGAPARRGFGAVWSGTHMVVWGGIDAFFSHALGTYEYDPMGDSWAPVDSVGEPPCAGMGGNSVWNGVQWMIWEIGPCDPRGAGLIYVPGP